MKRKGQIQVLLILFLILPGHLIAQNCETHHLDGDCHSDLQRGYKMYSQSHSSPISPLDTVEMNVVFYGQKDYILSFCTHNKLYPIHFVLIDQQTEEVLYDNEDDDYLESLGLGFDVAKPLTIKVDVLARKSTEEEITDKIGCLGLLIQYKNYPRKKVNLQL
jgi:hypothetical protein